MQLGGQDLTALSPRPHPHAGLGRAFQLTNLFPNLSVLENVRLAVQATQGGRTAGGSTCGASGATTATWTERAESILRSVALFERRDTPVASLPHGDQRKLEVAC